MSGGDKSTWLTPQRMCSRCRGPILDSEMSEVRDGYFWHQQCPRPGVVEQRLAQMNTTRHKGMPDA